MSFFKEVVRLAAVILPIEDRVELFETVMKLFSRNQTFFTRVEDDEDLVRP